MQPVTITVGLKSETELRHDEDRVEQLTSTRIDVDVGAADVVLSLHLAQVAELTPGISLPCLGLLDPKFSQRFWLFLSVR